MRPLLILLALLLAALAAPQASRAGEPPPVYSYTITALGSLGGASAAYGVNDTAQVVGMSYTPFNSGVLHRRAFLWQDGHMADLGTLGGRESWAFDINNSGQVVGWAMTSGSVPRAFLWSADTAMRPLGALGGSTSYAYSLNDIGQVVGGASLPNERTHAVLWQNGQIYDLGAPTPFLQSHAVSVNAGGQVLGYAWNLSGEGRAFLWTPNQPNGTTGAFSVFPAGEQALALNADGAIAGAVSELSGYQLPSVRDNSGSLALPLLAGASRGSAYALNDSHQVVGENATLNFGGEFEDYWTYDAFIWDSARGTRSLRSLLGGIGGPEEARAISSSGLIAANYKSYQSYLLVPSPLPIRPADLRVASFVESGRVSLYWSAVDGADAYTVKRSTSSVGPFATLVSNLPEPSYSDTTVVNGVRYYYVVSATNTYGETADSNVAVGEPQAPPDPPAGLTGAPGDQQVSLTWNPSPTADYYKVFRATASGGPYYWIAISDVTNMTDYGDWDEWSAYPLTNGKPYYYVVTAVNNGGESSYSQEASATPVAPPAPAAPTGLSAFAGEDRVDLSWSASANAVDYRIQRRESSGDVYTEIGIIGGSTTFSDYQVTAGSTYFYVVTARNSGGESPVSNEVSGTPTGPPPPAAPTRLRATAGKRRVLLRWKRSINSGVTQTRVYRSTDGGDSYVLRATLKGGAAFLDTGLRPHATYFYVVTAVLAGGKESSLSNQVRAIPRQ